VPSLPKSVTNLGMVKMGRIAESGCN
jgi:hypothetical protein